ncbi:hypothetical protein Ahy_A02g009802 [Arachis hypogaea]|uniref:TMV resistance protein N n=1 Tax=Arachis hypogaea TaxID=3818 RepID=A0A445EI88_ARAHY|nr:hypothetical protein Ahy_A02g009802 [Arachis hypogaea]
MNGFGTEAIQAIVHYAQPYEARWSSEAFSKTSNIRLLKIRNACRLSHGLDCLPYALRVLDWLGCPLKTLPLTDQLDVVDINLSWSKIEQLWHGAKVKSLVPDGFCGLSLLRDLDLSGNNFVNLPSDISKHSTLEYLCLNSCKKLQSLPELPLSIKRVDASNCASLVTCKFHPSSKCSIIASPVQWHLPRERKSLLKGICFPRTRFDMVITGNEIPSWFAPQKSSSFAEIPFPHPSPPTEWLGFALCFLLVADRPLRYYHTGITCYTAKQTSANEIMVPDKDDWRAETHVISRKVPDMEPKLPHLYILFLSIGEYLERMHTDTSIGFGLRTNSRGSPLRIVQAGCRVLDDVAKCLKASI